MKISLLILAVIGVSTLVLQFVIQEPQAEDSPAAAELADLNSYLNLASRDRDEVDNAIGHIQKNWDSGSAAMVLEAIQFTNIRGLRQRLTAMLQTKTGQMFGHDRNRWYQWLWSKPYLPHPKYAEFKSKIHSTIDPRFSEYFTETETATIRLDEIRWGGVKRDGIPPLKDPEMISVADAEYLSDSDVVFGVKFNDDARCYPKRILAWHEMFKDTIGGESVCGAY